MFHRILALDNLLQMLLYDYGDDDDDGDDDHDDDDDDDNLTHVYHTMINSLRIPQYQIGPHMFVRSGCCDLNRRPAFASQWLLQHSVPPTSNDPPHLGTG